MRATLGFLLASLLLPPALPAAESSIYLRTPQFTPQGGIARVYLQGRIVGRVLPDVPHDPAPLQASWAWEGERVAITLLGAARVSPTPSEGEAFQFALEVGPLPADAELLVRHLDPRDGQQVELARGYLTADRPPIEVTILPGESFPVGERPTFRLRAFRECHGPFTAIPLERRGKRLRLLIEEGCIVDPPPPPSWHEHVVLGPADLPAGAYQLDLVDIENDALISSDAFLVTPPEARVGENGRFAVEVRAVDGQGETLVARPTTAPDNRVDLAYESSLVYTFFSPDNWELLLKVLDGCAINGHYWVFGAAATDVEYEIEVRDRLLGRAKVYRHAAGTPSPALADTAAFPCR